jgi:hypothetical protein
MEGKWAIRRIPPVIGGWAHSGGGHGAVLTVDTEQTTSVSLTKAAPVKIGGSDFAAC